MVAACRNTTSSSNSSSISISTSIVLVVLVVLVVVAPVAVAVAVVVAVTVALAHCIGITSSSLWLTQLTSNSSSQESFGFFMLSQTSMSITLSGLQGVKKKIRLDLWKWSDLP